MFVDGEASVLRRWGSCGGTLRYLSRGASILYGVEGIGRDPETDKALSPKIEHFQTRSRILPEINILPNA